MLVKDREAGTSAGAREAAAPDPRQTGLQGKGGPGSVYESDRPLRFERYFTKPGVHPYDEIVWEYRTASIMNDEGKVIFKQENVEVPSFWSLLATNIVVSKYFRGGLGQPQREKSAKQLVDRVAKTVTGWGRKQNYFAAPEDAEAFEAELTHLLITQKMAFNSPVWFNVGIEEKPQCSACFINEVQDTMESILTLAKTEGMLFKWGSGTGTNLSPIRSSKEQLTSGGYASGPVSFMKGYDAFAGVIKSGGKTRRAAKMQILNIDHPDIVEFISAKTNEEKKAWTLIEAGYDGSLNGEAYASVFFQNANFSVRVTDDFMKAFVDDGEWNTRAVLDRRIVGTFRARDLVRQISQAAWKCGDPGLQFDTTINDWHTCAGTDRIYASNPCSEYMFLDNTACNLASINLLKFRRDDGSFDVASFRRAVRITITAQEILVDNASYPTPSIERNSFDYRPLGLGYANLGALLMADGIPYDSDEGRAYAGVLTAIMHGEAYRQSAEIARHTGPFRGYAKNREPMLRVIRKHQAAVENIRERLAPPELMDAAREIYREALALGEKHGYRNSQVTVLAPTGTIAFMMDCDTTGIEPDIALVKYKKLVGGGVLKIVNNTVPPALRRLGYDGEAVKRIVEFIDKHETIEGAPDLKPEHLPVFDCAFKPANGTRSIQYMGHVKMMGAAQPFLSGAISKTVNLPTEATVEDIEKTYVEAWRAGLKAIAIYRDGSKLAQPLNAGKGKKVKVEDKALSPQAAEDVRRGLTRRRLPDERRSITHKFSVGGHEGYITVGMYEDGAPGEIFITMAKEGSVVSGLMDSVATSTSIALQYGVPLKVLVNKFVHTRFEPSGWTGNPQIPFAKSILDYLFRWLALKFMPAEGAEGAVPAAAPSAVVVETTERAAAPPAGGNGTTMSAPAPRVGASIQAQTDAPPCHECGDMMVRNGACYKCLNCGATSGCS